MRPASISSSGIEAAAYTLARYTPNGDTMLGSSTDHTVLVSPTLENIRNSGKVITGNGTSTAAMIMVKMASRPRNEYFASAYPAAAESTTDSRRPTPA